MISLIWLALLTTPIPVEEEEELVDEPFPELVFTDAEEEEV